MTIRRSDGFRVAVAVLTVATLLVLGGCSVVRVGGPPPQVDVNAADARALARVPGIGPDDAKRILANRPYLEKEDLLRRYVLSEAQYAAAADHLSVGPPGVPEYLKSVPPMPEGR